MESTDSETSSSVEMQQQIGNVTSDTRGKHRILADMNRLDQESHFLEDQLGDVLHWIRQVVAVICGLLSGAIPLVGGIWIVIFLAISSGIIYGYYALILKVDEEEFGGHGTLLQEGLFASFTLFLLAWILVYSLAHF